jgi:hypothetical protein
MSWDWLRRHWRCWLPAWVANVVSDLAKHLAKRRRRRLAIVIHETMRSSRHHLETFVLLS